MLNQSQSETEELAGTLELKVNARVMLTVNVDLEDRLVNGQLGTVKHFQKDQNGNVLKIYIAFDDCEAGLKSISKDAFASQNVWVPIEKAEANIRIRTNKDSSPAVTRTQFPLMLAWGCTVHKFQGLTLEEVVISFDLVKQKNFNYGQMYVALSKVTSLNGLYFIGEFNLSYIRADPRAIYEYCRMRNEKKIQTIDIPSSSDKTFTFLLLNTRSFPKHAIDISKDKRLYQADILCLTETHITPEQTTHMADQHLSQFQFLNDRSEDKFQSLSVGYRDTVRIDFYYAVQGRSYVNLSKINFMNFSFRVLLLYRKNSENLNNFYENLIEINTHQNFDIILGDFNVNALEQNSQVKQVWSNYMQVVTESTQISCSLLNHIFICKQMNLDMIVQNVVITTYFSDHDAVFFTLQMKSD